MRAGNATEGYHKDSSPARALRNYFGDRLATQDGRYGTLADGTHVAALLTDTSRVRYADHGTNRV